MASVRRLLQRGRGSATLSVAGRPKRKSWLEPTSQMPKENAIAGIGGMRTSTVGRDPLVVGWASR